MVQSFLNSILISDTRPFVDSLFEVIRQGDGKIIFESSLGKLNKVESVQGTQHRRTELTLLQNLILIVTEITKDETKEEAKKVAGHLQEEEAAKIEITTTDLVEDPLTENDRDNLKNHAEIMKRKDTVIEVKIVLMIMATIV